MELFYLSRCLYDARQSAKFFTSLLLFFLPALALSPPVCLADEILISNAFLGTSYSSEEQRTSFKAHENIHLYLEFIGPIREPVELSVNWIAPDGNIERNHSQTLKPTTRKTPVYYSWLKLIKKGKLSRTLTNNDYDPSYGGRWQVFVYLDNREVYTLSFEVQI